MTLPAPTSVELDKLRLDKQNPRLKYDQQGQTQAQLLDWMLKTQDIDELGRSIAENGFMQNEPIVGLRDGTDIIVLEGNRRVAALKLLRDPSQAPERVRQEWTHLAEKFATRNQDISKILVSTVAARDAPEVEAYLAVRHVKGTKTWPPVQKAAFIAKLLQRDGTDFKAVAGKIGSNSATVKRHFLAYQLCEQARSAGVDGADELYDQFGVLMRAFQSPKILAFLGIEEPGEDPGTYGDPVPDDHLDQLKQFVKWTFGTSEYEKVLPESRQMTEWSEILSTPQALEYLGSVTKPNFWVAWEKSGGQVRTLVQLLTDAANALRQAVPTVKRNKDDPEVIGSFQECADYFGQILEHLHEHVEDTVRPA